MTPKRPGLTLLATGLGLFMVFLDATIVNVALPSIQSDFDVGESRRAVGGGRLQPHHGHVHDDLGVAVGLRSAGARHT